MRTLGDLGIDVIEMPPLPSHPDSVFIQDVGLASMSRRKAVIARLGEPSRRGEERDVEEYLFSLGFTTTRIAEPGTLEGGDIIVTDTERLYVGLSGRTNLQGAMQLRKEFSHLDVRIVEVRGILHLLSAAKYIGGNTFVYLPGHVDPSAFGNARMLRAPRTPLGLNFMYLGDDVAMVAAGSTELRDLLRREGLRTVEVDVSEFWKCDGSMTCLSFPLYTSI